MKEQDSLKEFLDSKEEGAKDLRYSSKWLSQEALDNNLKARKRKKIKKLGLGIGIPLVATASLAAMIIIPNLEIKTKSHSKTLQRKSSSLSNDTFKALNSVEYPSYSNPEQAAKNNPLSQDYVSSVNSFTYSLFEGLTIGEENLALSPYSIYRGLDILSLIGNSSTKDTFSALLGSESVRKSNRAKGFLSNNWSYSDEAVLMRDGLFFHSFFGDVKTSLINSLTSAYVEAYQMDFHDQSHLNKITEWLNGYSLDEGMFVLDDLPKMGYDEEPSFCLFSLQSVKLHWDTRYNEKDNKRDVFYKADGSETEKEFMCHTSMGVKLYDYGSYYSAYDAYKHGYYVQYLIPKSLDDNILDLLDRNFLIEDETKRLESGRFSSGLVISEFSLPKFSYTDRVDLSLVYQSLGLSSLMDYEVDSFGEAYEPGTGPTDPYNHYLKAAKSVTKVSMDEDGFISKSLVFHMAAGSGSAGQLDADTYDINLNQPFIYIIRDANGLPLNLGYYQG